MKNQKTSQALGTSSGILQQAIRDSPLSALKNHGIKISR